MTAAEQILLTEEDLAEAYSPSPEPVEPHLHLVTEADTRAISVAGAARALKASEFVVKFAAEALSAAMCTEPYRTNLDGSSVPSWLYRYRHYRYEHRLKPARARRERALITQTAAHTALLNVTAGAGESLWPGDPSPA